MKAIFLFTSLLVSSLVIAQSSNSKLEPCEVSEDFKEPQRDKKTAKWAKKINRFNDGAFPSITDIKDYVAIDSDVDIADVILLRMNEQAGSGLYIVCVDGIKKKYRRTGTVLLKDGERGY